MSRLAVLALVAVLALPAPGRAQSDGIEATIRSQIAAFLADDFAQAFTFASPSIKALFGTPENFGMMVRNGYPMVHRPADVRMLDRREVAGQTWQRVMITDSAGRLHVLEYQMLATPDGWQINAVRLLPQDGVGA